MFIDLETDAILLRDVFGPQCFCRDCHHYTYATGAEKAKRCAWCGSPNIGGQPALLGPTKAQGQVEPPQRPPTKHQRLRLGFAWLHGEWI